jgi:GTP:adenosylcobinamide-phosphate guanylyltransferase
MSMVFVPASNTTTARSFAVFLVDAMADALRKLSTRIADAGKPYEPRTAEELLEWAHSYEATQPSYAADLRAAALHAQEIAGGAKYN